MEIIMEGAVMVTITEEVATAIIMVWVMFRFLPDNKLVNSSSAARTSPTTSPQQVNNNKDKDG